MVNVSGNKVHNFAFVDVARHVSLFGQLHDVIKVLLIDFTIVSSRGPASKFSVVRKL